MKKEQVTRIAALAMAGVMAAAPALPAFAASPGKVYSGTKGVTDVYFEKFLTMDKEANVPNVTFTYSIAGIPLDQAQNAERDAAGNVINLQVYSGEDPSKTSGKPTVSTSAEFKVGDQTFDTVQDVPAEIKSQKKTDGTTVDKDNLTLASTKKYARKNLTVSFGNVTFKEPGVYRYVITEAAFTDSRANGITMDEDATRIMDVYVIHDETTNECKVEGYVLHDNEPTDKVPQNGDNPNGKADGFANDYETEDLTIEKKVAGNQGSKDEYFEFTLNIENAISGTKYDVDISNADASTKVTAINGTSHNNPTSITAGTDGKATATFWLQHGQSVKVNGLAKNTLYTINENAEVIKNEGYKAEVEKFNMEPADSLKEADTDAALNEDVVTDKTSGITADTKMTYTNTKGGVIPTGIVMTVLPFAAVTLAGGFGVTTIMMKKKHESDEEEDLQAKDI